MGVEDDELRDVIATETSAVLSTLGRLRGADLASRSGVGDWTRGELAAHIADTGRSFAQWIDDALRGNAGPAPGHSFLRGPEASAVIAGSVRQPEQAAMVRQPVESVRATAVELDAVISRLGREDYTRSAYHITGTTQIRRILQFRVAELALHHWDLLTGLGRTPRLSPRSTEALLDWVAHWLERCFAAAPPGEQPVTFMFDVRGHEAVRTIVHNDRVRFGEAGASDVTVACDAETYLLFCTGRLDVEHAVSSEQMRLTGNPGLLSTFRQRFPPI